MFAAIVAAAMSVRRLDLRLKQAFLLNQKQIGYNFFTPLVHVNRIPQKFTIKWEI